MQQAGDAVVLSMAYPQTADEFLGSLAATIATATDAGWRNGLDFEVGLDLGVADARLRRPGRARGDARCAARSGAWPSDPAHHHRAAVVMIDDVDLVADPRATCCSSCAHARSSSTRPDLPIAFVVAASPGLFSSVRAAHEPLVRFFEPLTVGPLEPACGRRARSRIRSARPRSASTAPSSPTSSSSSGGRPYYLQKLAYFAFDAAVDGRVGRAEFAVAFERAFASVSQEIFAARWAAMSPTEREVVGARRR